MSFNLTYNSHTMNVPSWILNNRLSKILYILRNCIIILINPWFSLNWFLYEVCSSNSSRIKSPIIH